jgi:hypothetical protein
MENFFYNDKFYSDLGELCDDLDLDDDAIAALPDDWSIEATESKCEKIANITPQFIAQAIDDVRWPEDSDNVFDKVIKALKGIDYAAINAAMPELYYDTEKPFSIEKSDLIGEAPEPMKEGDFVHYTPDHGPKENGRIKTIGKEFASVVYKCDGEWELYMEYTGARTELSRLSRGWIDSDEPKEKQP